MTVCILGQSGAKVGIGNRHFSCTAEDPDKQLRYPAAQLDTVHTFDRTHVAYKEDIYSCPLSQRREDNVFHDLWFRAHA